MGMFDRFTQRARHVVVLAQQEARTLRHNHIGTEHLLLGLLGQPDSIGGQVLLSFGLEPAPAREQVAQQVPVSPKAPEGHLPFTPRSKKVLEHALREALGLGHNYIGTEHVLLGMLRDPDSVGAQIIAARAGDLARVRQAVIDVVPAPDSSASLRWVRKGGWGTGAGWGRSEDLRITPAADNSLNAAVRIAAGRPVGSHHLLLAALGDPRSAAARALIDAGIDLDRARRALHDVDIAGTDDEPPEEAGRRQMVLRVAGDHLILETSDPELVTLARAAAKALGPDAGPPDTILGDRPAAAGLASVWTALRAGLEDIRRRAGGRESTGAASGRPVDPSPEATPAGDDDAPEGGAAG